MSRRRICAVARSGSLISQAALALLLGSALAGWLWDQFGASSTFAAGAALCALALLAILKSRAGRAKQTVA